jgi:hypothetical protein
MKLLEELVPTVKAEAPEQSQLVDNVAIALNTLDHLNCGEHSTRRDRNYNWSPTNWPASTTSGGVQ